MPAPETLRSRDALSILRAGVAAVEPGACVRRYVQRQDAGTLLIDGEPWRLPAQVHLIAAGKGAATMAVAVQDVLGDLPGQRLIVVPAGGPPAAGAIVAGHPLPDDRGVGAARRTAAILEAAGADDLVILALSGGASSLLADVADGVSLDDLRATTALLQRAGATIGELNALRKHLSYLKGGQAVTLARPARVLALVLSDVVDSPLEVIASGPTVADPTSFDDCLEILRRHGLDTAVPPAVFQRLRAGAKGEIAETPKPGNALLAGVRTLLIGDNRLALAAAAARARQLGYRARVLTARLTGEARRVGARLGVLATRHCRRRPLHRDSCLLFGGETTVTVRGSGRGGRNQEMVLAAVPALDGLRDVCLASLGTDGVDGTSLAAGAWADGEVARRAVQLGADISGYLERNDSDGFFRVLGTAIETGPTGTNVMDLQVMLVGAR